MYDFGQELHCSAHWEKHSFSSIASNMAASSSSSTSLSLTIASSSLLQRCASATYSTNWVYVLESCLSRLAAARLRLRGGGQFWTKWDSDLQLKQLLRQLFANDFGLWLVKTKRPFPLHKIFFAVRFVLDITSDAWEEETVVELLCSSWAEISRSEYNFWNDKFPAAMQDKDSFAHLSPITALQRNSILCAFHLCVWRIRRDIDIMRL